MSPRKQPSTLMKICITTCIDMIHSSSLYIVNNRFSDQLREPDTTELLMKDYVWSILPCRLIENLFSEISQSEICGNFIMLRILAHPNMKVLKRPNIFCGSNEQIWSAILLNLTRLVVLDITGVCTDGILKVVGAECTLLENINILSDYQKTGSGYNNSERRRRLVTNAGLRSIRNLKRLRILTMDKPKKTGGSRWVTYRGLVMLINELPYLEELNIHRWAFDTALIRSIEHMSQLNLRKISCYTIPVDDCKTLIRLCPHVTELTVLYSSNNIRNDILEQICISDWTLQSLKLMRFPYNNTLQQILAAKGSYLTEFCLMDKEQSFNFDAILFIGEHCPNLVVLDLDLSTQPKALVVPPYYEHSRIFFTKLQSLTIGKENFNEDTILEFFVDSAQNLQELIIRYSYTYTYIDDRLLNMLKKGNLKCIHILWLENFIVSHNVAIQVIDSCQYLKRFVAGFVNGVDNISRYIRKYNLDLEIDFLCY